jgi:hypothetical protein
MVEKKKTSDREKTLRKPSVRALDSEPKLKKTAQKRERPVKDARSVSISSKDFARALEEAQDQLALIHGVLEELCERQEAMVAWQLDFAKHIMAMQSTSQSGSLTTVPNKFDDALETVENAEDLFESMEEDFSKKRDKRKLKSAQAAKRSTHAAGFTGDEDSENNEASVDSILVLPNSPFVH